MLAEGVEAGLDGVARDGGSDGGLGTGVVGGAVGGGGDGSVVGVGVVVGEVVVVEGRELEDSGGVEGVDPGEGGDDVGLALGVAEAGGVELLVLEAVGVGVVGDLEEVVAGLRDEAELIFGGAVVDEGGEGSVAVGGVVEDFGDGWREAVVAAVAVEARCTRRSFGSGRPG